MKRLIPILLIVLSSCSPRLMVEQRDSTYTTVTNGFRDTTIQVPVPSERVTAITPLDSAFRLQTTITEVIIKPMDNGQFNVDLHHREGAYILTVFQMPYQQVTTVKESIRREVQVVEKNVLYWWQKALIWFGVVAFVLFVGKWVWRIWGSKIKSAFNAIKLL